MVGMDEAKLNEFEMNICTLPLVVHIFIGRRFFSIFFYKPWANNFVTRSKRPIELPRHFRSLGLVAPLQNPQSGRE